MGRAVTGTIDHHVNPTPLPLATGPPGRLSSTGGRKGKFSRALCALFFFAPLCGATTKTPAGRGRYEPPQGKDNAMDVTLDPQQAPARAELLLAAGFGQEARGRPIHGRLESGLRLRRASPGRG